MLNVRYSRGFSAIELAITVLIVAIIVVVSTPAFRGMIANQRIRTVSESLRSGMQLARIEALKRSAAVYFDMSAIDSSWFVGCETPDPNDNDGDGLADCPSQIQTESVVAEGGASAITITTTAGTRATFSALGLVRQQNADGSAPIAQLDVTAPGVDAAELIPLRVLLPTGGLSRVCNPAISTVGDPRKC